MTMLEDDGASMVSWLWMTIVSQTTYGHGNLS